MHDRQLGVAGGRVGRAARAHGEDAQRRVAEVRADVDAERDLRDVLEVLGEGSPNPS